MKKKTIKKWYHKIIKSMDTITYDFDGESEYITEIHQSDKKPLTKSFVNRILNNKSFRTYLSSHWLMNYENIHIITKSSEWYGIWWYKYPDKKVTKDTKYRCVMVLSELRSPECYILEDKNRTAFYA